jgi:hypothetical protein
MATRIIPTLYIDTTQPDPASPCSLCQQPGSITIRTHGRRDHLCHTCADQHAPGLAHNTGFNARVLALINTHRADSAPEILSLPVDSPQLRETLPAALQALGHNHDVITEAVDHISIGGA